MGFRGIATDRVNRSVMWEIAGKVIANHSEGQSWQQAAQNAALEEALELYRPKVEAMLRSAGFDVAEGAPLTMETVASAIQQRTGLDISSLDVNTIKNAISEQLSIYVSSELGFQVTNVLDANSIRQQINAHIKDCVQSGRSSKLVPRRLITQISEAAAFAQMGKSYDDRRAVLNRWYQKKYRRSHKLVWQ